MVITRSVIVKAFALPGLLLPISIFAVEIFMGNSALYIYLHNFYGGALLVNFIESNYGLLLFVSWIFHIGLAAKNVLPKKWAWLHAGISIICLFGVFLSLPQTGLAGMPRRYYDYAYGLQPVTCNL